MNKEMKGLYERPECEMLVAQTEVILSGSTGERFSDPEKWTGSNGWN